MDDFGAQGVGLKGVGGGGRGELLGRGDAQGLDHGLDDFPYQYCIRNG